MPDKVRTSKYPVLEHATSLWRALCRDTTGTLPPLDLHVAKTLLGRMYDGTKGRLDDGKTKAIFVGLDELAVLCGYSATSRKMIRAAVVNLNKEGVILMEPPTRGGGANRYACGDIYWLRKLDADHFDYDNLIIEGAERPVTIDPSTGDYRPQTPVTIDPSTGDYRPHKKTLQMTRDDTNLEDTSEGDLNFFDEEEDISNEQQAPSSASLSSSTDHSVMSRVSDLAPGDF
jgi:hypothetical protein